MRRISSPVAVISPPPGDTAGLRPQGHPDTVRVAAHEQLHSLLGLFQGEDVSRDLLDGVSAGVDEPHRVRDLGHLAQGAFQGQLR